MPAFVAAAKGAIVQHHEGVEDDFDVAVLFATPPHQDMSLQKFSAHVIIKHRHFMFPDVAALRVAAAHVHAALVQAGMHGWANMMDMSVYTPWRSVSNAPG